VPILVLPLVVAGCSGSGDPAQSSGRPSVPDSTLAVEGGTSGHFDTTVRNALDDVFAFWRAEYPTLSGGTPLPPLSGGLFSVDASSVVTTLTLRPDRGFRRRGGVRPGERALHGQDRSGAALGRTTMTGQRACSTHWRLTEPSSMLAKPPRPR